MKIDKTEQEFRDALYEELPTLAGDYSQFQVGTALIKALGLEFREEEGFPEVLAYGVDNDRGFTLLDGEGNHLSVVAVTGGRRVVDILLKALGRYNDFPKLEALAREMGEVLKGHIMSGHLFFRENGRNLPGGHVRDLLSRLRELLGEEGA